MGLVNARNLRKAKELLEKNRHKVGDVVGKAATKLDTVSGGKTANISKKAEEAARKYSAAGAPDIGTHAGVPQAPPPAPQTSQAPPPPQAPPFPHAPPPPQATQATQATQSRQTDANIAAANALTAAANEMLQQAAELQANAFGGVPSADPDSPSQPDRDDQPGS